MYHSITFGVNDKFFNTWDDWHIVPESRPVINPPSPKTNYVEVPGMDGSLDYTEALGSLKYNNREGSWTFYVMNDYTDKNYKFNSWNELYNEILEAVHGKYVMVWSEDDPKYVYHGRVTINEWNSGDPNYSKITISYNLEPYKNKASLDQNGKPKKDTDISTASADWKWDELYTNTIVYGKFDVSNRKVRTLYNKYDDDLEISITLTAPMSITYRGKEYKLSSGKNRDSGIILRPGDNQILFEGNGQVIIDYDKDGVVL